MYYKSISYNVMNKIKLTKSDYIQGWHGGQTS
jgi:hypothetical protein